jgi:anti-sigma regulatory factor (Ser/Thr protein kinase)
VRPEPTSRRNQEVAHARSGVASAHVLDALGALTDPSVSLRLLRGPQAPRQAREAVIAQLGERLGTAVVYDVALVVSELVTNSLKQPELDSARELGVEVELEGDHVLIAVSDRGAQIVPRREPRAPVGSERLGLLLVDRLADAWGVARDAVGRTRVWCELPLDPP